MKIKKTLTSKEIEFTTQELQELIYNVPQPVFQGLRIWVKDNFGLDLHYVLPNPSVQKKEGDK